MPSAPLVLLVVPQAPKELLAHLVQLELEALLVLLVVPLGLLVRLLLPI